MNPNNRRHIALFSRRLQSPGAYSRPLYLQLAKPDFGQQISSDNIRNKTSSRGRHIVRAVTVLLEPKVSCYGPPVGRTLPRRPGFKYPTLHLHRRVARSPRTPYYCVFYTHLAESLVDFPTNFTRGWLCAVQNLEFKLVCAVRSTHVHRYSIVLVALVQHSHEHSPICLEDRLFTTPALLTVFRWERQTRMRQNPFGSKRVQPLFMGLELELA